MKQRLYFVLPDLSTAHELDEELSAAKLLDDDVHFLAQDDLSATGLPEATLLQRSDLLHGAEAGSLIGALAGAFAGAVMLWLSPGSVLSSAEMLLLLVGLGTMVGGWAAGLIGSGLPHRDLRPFAPALARGYILMMVDVGRRERARVLDVLYRHHADPWLRE